MRVPDCHGSSQLGKEEGGEVELARKFNTVVVLLLLLLCILVLLHLLVKHLSRGKNTAKEASMMGTDCWLRTHILPMIERVKLPVVDFSKGQDCFSSLQQRTTPLGPKSQRRGPFGFPKQRRHLTSASEICLRLQGKRTISRLIPVRRTLTRQPDFRSFFQSSTNFQQCLPKIRANPIRNPSQSLDNLVPSFCPSDSKMASVDTKSVPDLYHGHYSAIFTNSPHLRRSQTKSPLARVKQQTEVQAKSLPDISNRCQPDNLVADKSLSNTACTLPMPTFVRRPHVKSSHWRHNKSPAHGKSSHRQHTTTNTKSLFRLEKFQT